MIYVKVEELLKKKKQTRYWLVKEMDSTYNTVNSLVDNKVTGIQFETLEKLCNVFECEPGEILVIKKTNSRRKKNEQTTKTIWRAKKER